ncbi:hypothetical protein MCUN1_000678 [Malassezia cuniculi]|uniref:Actin-related protein n=1 Tax=Malassezia cuniculi TaxID=948313 RepID=A0AAF0J5A1_9BASI|nr:hypothetical protein MCUN1_000678 [Malassezia cuniculi]
MSTREARTLLIVHSAQRVFAGIGIADPFLRPTISLPAFVGRATPDGPWIVGDELSNAQGDVQVISPIVDGDVTNWEALAVLWHHILEKLGVSPSSNESFTLLGLPAPISREAYERSAQVFFEQLNAPALSIMESPLLAAYATGVVSALTIDIGADETAVSAVCDCVVIPSATLVTRVGITHCIYWFAVLLAQDQAVVSAIASLPGDRGELLYALAQQALADGHVSVGTDSDAFDNANDLGEFDVATALLEGRERDVVQERQKQKDKKKRTDGNEPAIVSFRGVSVPLGRLRFRFHEPLLRPKLLLNEMEGIPVPPAVAAARASLSDGGEPPCMSIPETINLAVSKTPNDRRAALWEALVVTGDGSQIKGLVNEILRVADVFTTNEATEAAQILGEPNALQPHAVRALKTPDYFYEFKERPELMPFLGGTIVAKLVFGDLSGRNYITKTQYNEHGPSVAFAVGGGA